MSHGFSLVLPAHTVSWLPPGEIDDEATTGDIILLHDDTIASAAIDKGQVVLALTESSIKPFVWVTHCAYVREGGAGAVISEMGFSGYRRVPLSKYEKVGYARVHFDFSDEQRSTTLSDDDALSGVAYGWAQYVPLILDGITNSRFEGSWGSSVICSTQVVLVLMGGGLFPDRPPGLVVPARIASWVNALQPAT